MKLQIFQVHRYVELNLKSNNMHSKYKHISRNFKYKSVRRPNDALKVSEPFTLSKFSLPKEMLTMV